MDTASSDCTGLKPVTNAKVVTLSDFQGAIYILGAGMMISVLVLGVEHAVIRYKETKHKPVIHLERRPLNDIRNKAYSYNYEQLQMDYHYR